MLSGVVYVMLYTFYGLTLIHTLKKSSASLHATEGVLCKICMRYLQLTAILVIATRAKREEPLLKILIDISLSVFSWIDISCLLKSTGMSPTLVLIGAGFVYVPLVLFFNALLCLICTVVAFGFAQLRRLC